MVFKYIIFNNCILEEVKGGEYIGLITLYTIITSIQTEFKSLEVIFFVYMNLYIQYKDLSPIT